MTPGQMLWRHRRGKTLDQLAEDTGLSRYQVFRIIKAEKWRSGEVVITEKALRSLVKKGYTVRQMSDHFYCSKDCICRRLKKYGITTRPRGNPQWNKRCTDKVKNTEV